VAIPVRMNLRKHARFAAPTSRPFPRWIKINHKH
jgi:hypothetical protein